MLLSPCANCSLTTNGNAISTMSRRSTTTTGRQTSTCGRAIRKARLVATICVGGIAAYGQMEQDLFLTGKKNGKDGVLKNYYMTLMPAVKLDWLRQKNFGMYSKLAIGATLRSEKIDYETAGHDDYSNTEMHVNWQVSLLGLEVGGRNLRGFLEVGTGEQGIFDIGLRYKF